MNRQRNVLLALFGWLSLFVLMANGQQAEVVTKITDEELEVMSDQELELICIERGFELIQDEMEDGDLTHEDYVDAAKRCLAIEEDMNEILMQNPELAEELLSEVDRLKEEKERMEKERERMLAEKERLEQQLAERQKQRQQQTEQQQESPKLWGASDSSESATATNATERTESLSSSATAKGGTAFAPHKSSSSQQQQATRTSTTTTSAMDGSSDDSAIADDEKEEAIDDYDYVHEELVDTTKNETVVPKPDECLSEPEQSLLESATAAAATTSNGTAASTQFSLSGFIQEVMNEFEKDVQRITRLIYPVVKPLMEAKDKAWKYLRAIYDSAKRHMEQFQSKPQQEKQQQER